MYKVVTLSVQRESTNCIRGVQASTSHRILFYFLFEISNLGRMLIDKPRTFFIPIDGCHT